MGRRLASLLDAAALAPLRTAAAAAVLLAALALWLPGELAGASGTPGVTPSTILLGGTVPLSGPATAFGAIATGAAAYFKYVNAHGGVNGRKILYEYLDDAYDPAQTAQQTRRLVEQDNVFAVFNSAGTANVEAVRPYLNQLGVPQLFAGSGASSLGRDYKRYPWSLGYLPSFSAEGQVYGAYVAQHNPGATIAVLYENSDFGKDLVAGLEQGLGSHAGQIVARQSYEPTDTDVSSQVAQLRSSNASTFMVFATPKYAIESFIGTDKLGWHPQFFVAYVSIAPAIMDIIRATIGKQGAEGAISVAFIKDPTNLKVWGKDSGMRGYYDIMRTYAPGTDPRDAYNLYGMAVAYTMVDALKHAGRDLTRQALLDAATRLNETDNPFLLPGIVVRTTPSYHFPITQTRIYRYHDGFWTPFTGLVSARG